MAVADEGSGYVLSLATDRLRALEEVGGSAVRAAMLAEFRQRAKRQWRRPGPGPSEGPAMESVAERKRKLVDWGRGDGHDGQRPAVVDPHPPEAD